MEFIKGVTLILGGTASFIFLWLGIKVLLSDRTDYSMNRDLAGGFMATLKGDVKTFRDGVRDYHVKAGLAIDRKSNQWVEQGALSEESIDLILR